MGRERFSVFCLDDNQLRQPAQMKHLGDKSEVFAIGPKTEWHHYIVVDTYVIRET